MKVLLAKIASLVLVCALLFTACDSLLSSGNGNENGNNNENGNGNNNGNGQSPKFTVGYLSNLMVDIGDAAALGIAKKSVTRTGNRSARAVTDVEEIIEKNYLVKITTDISHGNVEWDESGLTNVTFKKKTTIDTTVWIPVFDEEGEPVYITDEEGDLILDENEEPIQEMQIIEDQTVTQDEIPAQVNKLYVYNTYTFIQFVPADTATIPDTRPDDLGKPDKAGYYDYDKCDYYNDDFHQSFVIENSTGNIYSLDDGVYITYIHNGLLNMQNSGWIHDLRINANDELEIYSLFQNANIGVSDYFKDKYGNNYIFNGSIDQTVRETNTIFFTKPEYHVTATGEVLHIQGVSGSAYPLWVNIGSGHESSGYFTANAGFNGSIKTAYPSSDTDIIQIEVVMPDCQYRAVTADDEFYFNGYDGAVLTEFWLYLSHLTNKELYIYKKPISNIDEMYFIINTDDGKAKKAFTFDSGIPLSYNTFIYHLEDRLGQGEMGLYGYKFDYATVTTVKYGIEYADINSATQVFFLANAVDKYNTKKWTVTTLDGEIEYTVVLQEINGERIPVAVKTSEYVAEEQQVITLKPINR